MNKLNRSSWTKDIGITSNGRHFTWDPQRFITPKMDDFIFVSVYKNFKFYVFVHDVKFYTVSTNPLGTTSAFWEFEANSMPSHYQELTLVKHKRLNLEHQPCEEAEDYSFIRCVKESLAEQIGCRQPWDLG